jgi:hypothetical protein
MFSAICIRFTRDEEAANDDVVKITPCLTKEVDGDVSTEYTVVYRFGKSSVVGGNTSTTRLDWCKLYRYVESLLTFVTNDEMPFTSVQIDLPMIPSIVLSQNRMLSYTVLPEILEHMKNLRTAWPCNSSSAPKPAKTLELRRPPRHMTFGEDGRTVIDYKY